MMIRDVGREGDTYPIFRIPFLLRRDPQFCFIIFEIFLDPFLVSRTGFFVGFVTFFLAKIIEQLLWFLRYTL